MGSTVERAAEGLYRRLWAWIEEWLLVPRDPPTLPARPGEAVESFRPAPGFISYLKLWFWIALVAIDGLILLGWIGITVALWWLGLLLLVPALILAVVPDIVAYVAIHLRYDATWYVLGDRSLRIRRGIWRIHEVTITFENVQNVRVSQGPVQRFFGIADVVVETAGGGAVPGREGAAVLNRGVLEGVGDAPGIRDRILQRLRRSRSAGLGDDLEEWGGTNTREPPWTEEHLAVLREIREAVRRL